ncbi:hypothetical protein ACTXT7_014507 [Hymenolepis weldensis]
MATSLSNRQENVFVHISDLTFSLVHFAPKLDTDLVNVLFLLANIFDCVDNEIFMNLKHSTNMTQFFYSLDDFLIRCSSDEQRTQTLSAFSSHLLSAFAFTFGEGYCILLAFMKSISLARS